MQLDISRGNMWGTADSSESVAFLYLFFEDRPTSLSCLWQGHLSIHAVVTVLGPQVSFERGEGRLMLPAASRVGMIAGGNQMKPTPTKGPTLHRGIDKIKQWLLLAGHGTINDWYIAFTSTY